MKSFAKATLLEAMLSTVTAVVPMDTPFERGEDYWTQPSDENKTDFFGQLTPQKSQREDWYFACALSNAGFMYVGLKYECPELLFAGTASIVSHSIPKKWLLTVDLIGVAAVGLKIAREYKTIQANPWLIAPVGAMGIINATDAYLGRNQR